LGAQFLAQQYFRALDREPRAQRFLVPCELLGPPLRFPRVPLVRFSPLQRGRGRAGRCASASASAPGIQAQLLNFALQAFELGLDFAPLALGGLAARAPSAIFLEISSACARKSARRIFTMQ